MKAQSKEQFEKAWNNHIDDLKIMALNLDHIQLTAFLDSLDYVKTFVPLASKNLKFDK
jgi:hypothetical protein